MSKKTTASDPSEKSYWQQDLPTNMAKLKVDNLSSESSPIFPPEIEEMILERIRHQPTLFSCRLISSHWNSIVNSILERRRLSIWTTWEPDWIELPTSPKIETCDNLTAPIPFIPETLEFPIGNPFPGNSLCILGGCLDNDYGLDMYYSAQPELKLPEFAPKYGHFLTSLIFRGLQLSCHELESFLIHTPNLKALALYDIEFLEIFSKPKSVCPPNLEHLYIYSCKNGFLTHFLPFCAYQLITLHVECSGNFPAEIEMGKLKHLKIDDNCLKNVTERMELDYTSNSHSLTHLSIRYKRWIGESTLREETAVNFVGKFATSLKYLYLDLYLGISDGEIAWRETRLLKLLREGTPFPNLKTLVLPNRCGWSENDLKDSLNLKFPSLKCVNYCSTY